MADQFRTRICLRRRLDLKVDVFLYSLDERRERHMGMTAGPTQDDVDYKVKKIKQQLERAGHEVHVVTMR